LFLNKIKFLMILEFSLEREIETPTMSFGGQKGKTVTFLVLKRNE